MAKKDIYVETTNALIAQLEQGVVPWVQDWKPARQDRPMPYNAVSKRDYRSGNAFILWIRAMVQKYPTNGWMTMKQANELGGTVRKGEQATWVIFWKKMMIEDKETKEQKKIMLQRFYMVFNVAQIDGLPEKYAAPQPLVLPETSLAQCAKRMGVDVREGEPAYYPALDYIKMPKPEAFPSVDAFQRTLGHELGHATGHESRLKRDLVGYGSGNIEKYANEELIAEMTSAFLCAILGIQSEGLVHASYLGMYLKAMKADPKLLLNAASAAQKATDMILGVTHEDKKDEDKKVVPFKAKGKAKPKAKNKKTKLKAAA